jgi:hypothetical protein
MCYKQTFIWKAAFRNNNKIHQDIMKELQRQIDVKTLEVKSIVPAKEFDPQDFVDVVEELDITLLLKTYCVDNSRIGETIQSTMFNAKTFLNKQFSEMQRLYNLEQERLIKERESGKTQLTKSKGFLGGLLSKIGGKKNTGQPQAKVEEEKDIKQIHNEKYLLSTIEESKNPQANLLEFDDESQSNQNFEKEVPVKIDEEESKFGDTETNQETVDDESLNFCENRRRSDSISSTSTNRIYSHKDLNDIVNINELHKFMYKCGALLVTQSPEKMEEWVDWMQRTLSEYYVN